MTHDPRVEQRAEQPYLAVAARVSGEDEFKAAVDSGFPALFGWLAANDIAPAGPPFIRYVELDADGDPLEFEIAAPLASAVDGEGEIRAGVLPAGRYATLLHVGPYRHADVPDLDSARETLLAWAQSEGIDLERTDTGAGSSYRASVEHYLTDASREPDWSKWQTELAVLTALDPS